MSNERSLMNLCLDLTEMAEEEQEVAIYEKLSSIGTKVDSYIGLNNFAESQIDVIKNEIAYLNKRIKSYERIQDGLKYRAKEALNILALDSLEGENGHKMSLRESQSVEVTNLSLVPEKFVKKEISLTCDKTAVKGILRSGVDIPGVKLVTKKNVVFK